MKKIKLTIQGMHCASCASNIERSLKEVSVSLMMNKGLVEAENKVSDEELKKAVTIEDKELRNWKRKIVQENNSEDYKYSTHINKMFLSHPIESFDDFRFISGGLIWEKY